MRCIFAEPKVATRHICTTLLNHLVAEGPRGRAALRQLRHDSTHRSHAMRVGEGVVVMQARQSNSTAPRAPSSSTKSWAPSQGHWTWGIMRTSSNEHKVMTHKSSHMYTAHAASTKSWLGAICSVRSAVAQERSADNSVYGASYLMKPKCFATASWS